jgi:hypothetical protein
MTFFAFPAASVVLRGAPLCGIARTHCKCASRAPVHRLRAIPSELARLLLDIDVFPTSVLSLIICSPTDNRLSILNAVIVCNLPNTLQKFRYGFECCPWLQINDHRQQQHAGPV